MAQHKYRNGQTMAEIREEEAQSGKQRLFQQVIDRHRSSLKVHEGHEADDRANWFRMIVGKLYFDNDLLTLRAEGELFEDGYAKTIILMNGDPVRIYVPYMSRKVYYIDGTRREQIDSHGRFYDELGISLAARENALADELDQMEAADGEGD